MRRWTIRSLIALVCVLGLSFAALRGANTNWAGGSLLVTSFVFGWVLIAALCGVPSARARRLGFVILGGGYFALLFAGLDDVLPTTRLLRYVHEHAIAAPQLHVTLTGQNLRLRMKIVSPAQGPNAPPAPLPPPEELEIPPEPPAPLPEPPAPPGSSYNPTARIRGFGLAGWRTVFPGANDYHAFSIVGHCEFSLLAGVLGSIMAVRIERRRIATEAREAERERDTPSDRTPGAG